MNKSKLDMKNLKVGLTMFVGLAIIFLSLFVIGTENNVFSEKYKLNIFLKNTLGMTNGSLVSLGGIKIGSVEAFEIKQINGVNGINVHLSIKKEYQQLITTKSYAIIKTIGLLGDHFVDISIGQKSDKPLKDGDYLTVKEVLSMDSFADRIEPVLNNFEVVMKNLNTISDKIANGDGSLGRLLENPKFANNLENVLKNLSSITNAIIKKEGSIGKLTYDSTLYSNLSTLSSNLKNITNGLSSGKGTLGKMLSSDKLYNKVNSISNRFDKLLAKTESSDTTLVGGIFNDGKLYKKVNALIVDLSKLLKDLKEHPENYVQFSVF